MNFRTKSKRSNRFLSNTLTNSLRSTQGVHAHPKLSAASQTLINVGANFEIPVRRLGASNQSNPNKKKSKFAIFTLKTTDPETEEIYSKLLLQSKEDMILYSIDLKKTVLESKMKEMNLDSELNNFVELTEDSLRTVNFKLSLDAESQKATISLKYKITDSMFLNGALDLHQIASFEDKPEEYCEYLTLCLTNLMQNVSNLDQHFSDYEDEEDDFRDYNVDNVSIYGGSDGSGGHFGFRSLHKKSDFSSLKKRSLLKPGARSVASKMTVHSADVILECENGLEYSETKAGTQRTKVALEPALSYQRSLRSGKRGKRMVRNFVKASRLKKRTKKFL